jgi:multicomponent Na+:H+ antiporter subunit E
MNHRLTTVAWLTAVWVMLWESLTWANVLGGVLVAGLVLAAVPAHRLETRVGFRPVAAARFLVHFVVQLVVASAKLTWEIFTPRNTINAAVVAVPLTCRVPGIVAVVASTVSLIPGTVTLDVDTDTMTLHMHVLHLTSVEQARQSVWELERLVTAAFPPRLGVAGGGVA